MEDPQHSYQEPSTLVWIQQDLSTFCRVCANSNDYLIPIFKGEGLENHLKIKIEQHLPIKICENDGLPNRICYQCASTLLAWHELFENCLTAEKRLNSLLEQHSSRLQESLKPDNENDTSFLDEQLGMITDGEDIDENVAPSASSNNDFQDTCSENIEKLKQPMKKRLRVSQTKNEEICDELSREEVLPENRFSASFKAYLEQVKMLKKMAKSDFFAKTQGKCSICEHQVKAGHIIKKAITETNTKEANSNSIDDTRKIKSKGSSKKNEVQESERTTKFIETVNRTETDSKVFSCEQCFRKFKYKDSFQRHARIHSNERPYSCLDCGKEFRDSGGLARHVRDVHVRLKKYRCNLCLKWFANKMTLDDHIRTHTGERPYICDSCGNMFKSKAALYNHTKTHTSVFPHSCNYCSKRFRRKQQLLDHIKIHTGEKAHICDKCGKGFRVRGELHRHIVIHSEEKPFTCFECGLGFRQKRYLKNHLKSRHSTVVFETPPQSDFPSFPLK